MSPQRIPREEDFEGPERPASEPAEPEAAPARPGEELRTEAMFYMVAVRFCCIPTVSNGMLRAHANIWLQSYHTLVRANDDVAAAIVERVGKEIFGEDEFAEAIRVSSPVVER